jgi:DNA segregation ATPase FtsK/SpoIIIE, S-DNA-T family
LLQRRLTIGYSRASRLIEAMANSGIVGSYKGSQAREALFTVEEWDAMQAQKQADTASGMTV